MAVPGKRGHLKTTANATFVKQTYGGVILGNGTTNAVITKAFSLVDALEDNALFGYDASPKEITATGRTYNARKILSGGAFAYNAAKNRTWVISRIATSLAGVAKTNLLFMSQGSRRKPILDFVHGFGARLLTAWRANLFTWTGTLDNGNKIKSRRLWLTSGSRNTVGGSAPSTLTNVNMFDLTDKNTTDKAVDDAATPTRAVPGEFVMQVDFVTKTIAGGNFFNYKPITGM
jgi:hypothetical protein